MNERGISIFNRPYQKASAAKAKKRRTLTRQEYKQNGKGSKRQHSTAVAQVTYRLPFILSLVFSR
jgi:hypothetical protein